MPTTKVSRIIGASQAQLWALLSDVEHADRWNRAWTEIEMTSAQTHGVGTRFRAKMEGGDDFFEFEICDWSAPERIAFCPVHAAHELYSITLESHVFQVRAISDQESEVTITARATARGLRGRVVSMFFWANHQEGGLNHALDAIQRLFQPELFEDEELELLPESSTEE